MPRLRAAQIRDLTPHLHGIEGALEDSPDRSAQLGDREYPPAARLGVIEEPARPERHEPAAARGSASLRSTLSMDRAFPVAASTVILAPQRRTSPVATEKGACMLVSNL